MNEVLLTNLFFAITAAATIVLTIVLIVVLIYITKLVRHTRRLIDLLTEEAEQVSDDLDEIREKVHEGSVMLQNMAVAKVLRKLGDTFFGQSKKKKK